MDERTHQRFLDFAHAEKALGGPDSHLEAAVWVSRHQPDPEWFLALYTCCYNVPNAEVLARVWPTRREVTLEMANDVWPVVIRKERRVNGFGPRKLSEALTSYCGWLENQHLELAEACRDYDAAWCLVQEVQHHGRYFGSKLYECLHRLRGRLPAASDIRPRGGTYTRRGLQLIFPNHDPKARSSEQEANELAGFLRIEADLTWFEVEVLLCNFRQATRGDQYPGRGLDSELGYLVAAEARHGGTFLLRRARLELFPATGLGECMGWNGRREGVTW